jgi:excinuclease UvrABC nuclease subunit
MEILDDKVRVWLDSAKFVKAIPGVYVLYDKNKETIYIGESENLQQTFSKYVDTNFEDDSSKQKTHSYQREFVENPKERKRILLEDFKTEHGKLPSCNHE